MDSASLIPEGLSQDLVNNINRDPLSFLVGDSAAFLKNNWEKKPVHVKANADRKKFFAGVCSLESIAKLGNDLAVEALKYEAKLDELEAKEMEAKEEEEDLDEDEDDEDDVGPPPPAPLLLGRDINAVRYVDGMRENLLEGMDPNSEAALVTEESLDEIYTQLQGTLQYHQPQRYDDRLWLLCAALEKKMECLVGANAYLTPKGTQGLAPHHDDVELWVCQTVGSKRWKLYKPFKGHELPTRPSPDLPEEELGEPVLEVTLEVGDVLFLPRGTVHEAVAQTCDAAHVTISTYQEFSLGQAANHLLYYSLRETDEATCAPIELRRGLPLGFLSQVGYQAQQLHAASAAPHAKQLAGALRTMAAKLEANTDMLHPAGDMLAMDFITSRLPPHPSQMPENNGRPPSPGDRFRSVGASYARVVRVPMDDAPPGRQMGLVKVVSCLSNDRLMHMIETGSDDEGSESEDEGAQLGGGCTNAACEDATCQDAACGEEEEDHDHDHDHDHGKHDHKHAHKSGKGQGAKGKAAESEEESEEDDDEAPEAIGLGDADSDEDEDDGSDSEASDEDDRELVFPEEFGSVIAKLLGCEDPKGLSLADLVIPESYFEGETPTADELEGIRMAIVTSLWEMGLVCTLEAPVEKKRKGDAKAQEDGKGGKKQKKSKK